MKGFSKKATQGVEKKSSRITSDNKYLKAVQVKNVEDVISEDCVLWVDGDSIPYFAAALQDDNYVEVTHVKSGRSMEFKNKTEFKGSSRKEGVITQKSWLGVKNLEQEAKGKPLFELKDFDIAQKKRLSDSEENCMEKAKSYMKDYFDAILEQSGCKTMKIVIGSGLNHRYDLELPSVYKGARQDQERPILLSKCREWVEGSYDTIVVEGEESDDRVQREAYLGTPAVNGLSKYTTMLCAIDKDSLGLPCLNFNYQKKGPLWVNPNPWVISDWEVDGDVGIIEMEDGKCRTTSLLHIARQLCTIDSADGYSMYLHFPKEMHPKEKFSDAGFYKQFCLLDTPKKVLEGIVERYRITWPYGLKYISHTGKEMDIDTMTYLEMIFTCVYMLRKPLGEESMKTWFDKYEVDYSCLVNNNKLSIPKRTFVGEETSILEIQDCLNSILTEDLKGCKQLKSKEKDAVFDCIKEKLESIDFESQYQMVQEEKQ